MKSRMFFMVAAMLCTLMIVSCKSDADVLKEATNQINQLTKEATTVTSAGELQAIAISFDEIIAPLEARFGEISEDELRKIEGSKYFFSAIERLELATTEAGNRIAGNMYDNFNNVLSAAANVVSDTRNALNEENAEEEEETPQEDYILTPGVTYYSEKEGKDEFGLRERYSLELTVYKDYSVEGKFTITAINEYRDNEETDLSYDIDGEWEETSKRDKRVMKIDVELANSSQYYTFFVDEKHQIYWNDLNSNPERLMEK